MDIFKNLKLIVCIATAIASQYKNLLFNAFILCYPNTRRVEFTFAVPILKVRKVLVTQRT